MVAYFTSIRLYGKTVFSLNVPIKKRLVDLISYDILKALIKGNLIKINKIFMGFFFEPC